MTISEIKEKPEMLEKKSKEELVYYVNELLLKEKQLNNKIISLNTEIRYINRHLTKVRDMIDKTLKTKIVEQEWSTENRWKK